MEFLRKAWYLFVGLAFCIVVLIVLNKKEEQDRMEALIQYVEILHKYQEVGYFEGQKDALEGDIRIDQDSAGCWYWSKSPWDPDGIGYVRQPVFKPE